MYRPDFDFGERLDGDALWDSVARFSCTPLALALGSQVPGVGEFHCLTRMPLVAKLMDSLEAHVECEDGVGITRPIRWWCNAFDELRERFGFEWVRLKAELDAYADESGVVRHCPCWRSNMRRFEVGPSAPVNQMMGRLWRGSGVEAVKPPPRKTPDIYCRWRVFGVPVSVVDGDSKVILDQIKEAGREIVDEVKKAGVFALKQAREMQREGVNVKVGFGAREVRTVNQATAPMIKSVTAASDRLEAALAGGTSWMNVAKVSVGCVSVAALALDMFGLVDIDKIGSKALHLGVAAACLSDSAYMYARQLLHQASMPVVQAAVGPIDLGAVAQMVSSVFLFVTLGSGGSHLASRFGSQLANHGKFVASAEGLMTFGISIVENTVNVIRGWMKCDKVRLYSRGSKEVDDWYVEVQNYLIKPYPKTVVGYSDHATRLSLYISAGTKILEQYPIDTHVASQIVRSLDLLRREIDKIPECGKAGGFRVEPALLLLVGGPGSGKTVLARAIAQGVIRMMAIRQGMEHDASKGYYYTRDGLNKYWDSYVNQLVVLLDEWGAAQEVPGGDNPAFDLIRMLNSAPYPLVMAELSDKGKRYFDSPFVIATTNQEKVSSMTTIIKTLGALTRRLNKGSYFIETRPEWKDWNGELDTERVANHVDEYGAFPDAWDIRPYVYTNEGGFRVAGDSLTYVDLLERFLASRDRNEATSDRFQRAYESDPRTWRQAMRGAPSQSAHNEGWSSILFGGMALTGIGNVFQRGGRSATVSTAEKIRDVLRQHPEGRCGDAADAIDEELVRPENSTDVLYGMVEHCVVDFFTEISNNVRSVLHRVWVFLDPNDEYWSVVSAIWDSLTMLALVGSAVFGIYWAFGGFAKSAEAVKPPQEIRVNVGTFKLNSKYNIVAEDHRKEAPPPDRAPVLVDVPTNPEQPVVQGITAARDLSDFENTANALKKATYALGFGNGHGLGVIHFIEQDVALMPDHFLDYLKFAVTDIAYQQDRVLEMSEPVFLVNVHDPSFQVRLTIADFLTAECVRIHEERDLVLVRLRNVRSPRSPINHFVESAWLRDNPNVDIMVDYVRVIGQKTVRCYSLATPKSPLLIKRGLNMPGEDLRSGMYMYATDSTGGDCGAWALIRDSTRARVPSAKILGIHTAGSSGWGYVTTVTKEELNDALGRFKGLIREAEPQNMPVYNQAAGHSLAGLQRMRDGPKLARNPNSQSQRSPFFGLLGPTTVGPALLAAKKGADGQFIDPFKIAAQKSCQTTGYFDDDALETARQVAFYPMQSQAWSSDRRIYDVEEAVRGVDQYFKPMPRGTSPGYPWNAEGLTNKQLFFGRGEDYTFEGPMFDRLMGDVAKVKLAAAKGLRSEHLFTACLKDETRPLEKVRNGETRIIYASPLCLTLLMRMYFGAFMRAVVRDRITNGLIIGLDHISEADRVYKHLTAGGPRVVAGDIKGLDRNVQRAVLAPLVHHINKWYGGTDEESRIREVLWEEVVHPRSIINEGGSATGIYQHDVLLCSGVPGTSIWGSYVVLIGLVVTFMRVAPQRVPLSFWRCIHVVIYGDDHIANPNAALLPVFTFQAVKRVFKEDLGLDLTPSEKGEDDGQPNKLLADEHLLSRKFWNDGGVMRLALREQTIIEILYWIRTTTKVNEAAQQNRETMLMELSLHPDHVWNRITPMVARKSLELYGIEADHQIKNRRSYLELYKRNPLPWSNVVGPLWPGITAITQSGGDGLLGNATVTGKISSNDPTTLGLEDAPLQVGVMDLIEAGERDVEAFRPEAPLPGGTDESALLARMFERDLLRSTLILTNEDSERVIYSASLVDLWMAHPAWQRAAGMFVGMRATTHVTLSIPPIATNYGRLRLCYDPTVESPSSTTVSWFQTIQLPGLDHCIHDLTSVELCVPYISPRSYLPFANVRGQIGRYSPGNVHVAVIMPLSIPSLQTLRGRIYVRLTDVELIGRCGAITQAGGPIMRKGKVGPPEAVQAGGMSTILSAASTISGVLAGPMSLATWFLGAASRAAASMGWSRPVFAKVPRTIMQFSHDYEPNVDMPTAALNLGMFSCTALKPAAFWGTGEDEMAITSIVTRPGLIWRQSLDVGGDVALDIPIGPMCAWFSEAKTSNYSTPAPPFVHAPFGYVADVFEYWRGTIIYTFRICRTQFHTGRFRIYIVYNHDNVSRQAQLTDCPTVIWDIQAAHEIEVTVPYVHWLPMADVGFQIGTLWMITDIPVACAPGMANKIPLQILVRAGPDMEFANPTTGAWKPIGPGREVVNQSGGVSLLVCGEPITSIKQLMMRPGYQATTLDSPYQWVVRTLCGRGNRVPGEQLTDYAGYFTPLYAFQRGSTVARFMSLTPGTNTRVALWHDQELNAFTNSIAARQQEPGQVCLVSAPYYAVTPFIHIWETFIGTTELSLSVGNVPAGTKVQVELALRAGDDYQLGFFRCCPFMEAIPLAGARVGPSAARRFTTPRIIAGDTQSPSSPLSPMRATALTAEPPPAMSRSGLLGC